MKRSVSADARLRPLADPKRAPFVRAALSLRSHKTERAALAALHADPKQLAKAKAGVAAVLALLDDDA